MSKRFYDPVMVIGSSICEQAGIDPKQVKSIDLHLHVGELAMMTVCFFPPQLDVAEEFRHFVITEVTNDGEEEGPNA